MEKGMEKLWCTYGGQIPLGFGKIKSDDYDNSVAIIRSEGDINPFLCTLKSIERFGKLEEAVMYYIQNRGECEERDVQISEKEVWNEARNKFPLYFKDKIKQEL